MTWTVPGYTELDELGRGGAGRVVLAQHDGTGTKVAIKYLADDLCRDREFIVAFRAEAQLLVEINAPTVVRLFEYVETDAAAAIVMELVDGVALRALLREHGATAPESALYVLKGSLLGLAAAHTLGVVHRDYKPENVLIDGVGASKLADFGIAARVGTAGPAAGTPSYMAPEQWRGRPATPQTDIYAATVVFYECVTGAKPYTGDTAIVLQLQHERAPIPTDALPESLRGLVERGMAKDPRKRPVDAATFLAELEETAAAGYGPDWEKSGHRKLAERAALLALLFPLAGEPISGTGAATTMLGLGRRAWVAIGAAVLVFGIGGTTAYALSNDAHTLTSSSSGPTLETTPLLPSPNPNPSPTPEGSPLPSPSATPGVSPSPDPGVDPASPNPGTGRPGVSPPVVLPPTKPPVPPASPPASPKPSPPPLTLRTTAKIPQPSCGTSSTTVIVTVTASDARTFTIFVAFTAYDAKGTPYTVPSQQMQGSGSKDYSFTFEPQKVMGRVFPSRAIATITTSPSSSGSPASAATSYCQLS